MNKETHEDKYKTEIAAQSKNTIRIEKLIDKRKKIDAQIKLAEARDRTKQRKEEVRRKILVGAYYLEQARNSNKVDELATIMRHYLERDSDKKMA